MSITINGAEYDQLAAFGLGEASDDVLDGAEYRNERESGYGDDEGEWFAVIDRHTAPGGRVYNVLISGTHGNDHAPGSSHYTTFELFDASDPDDDAEFRRQVKAWQDAPEWIGDDEDTEAA